MFHDGQKDSVIVDTNHTLFPFLHRDVSMNESVNSREVFYRLGDSELFQYANKNIRTGGDRLIDVLPRMTVSNQGFIHVSLDMMDKAVVYELFESNRYKLVGKMNIKKLIEQGKIQMVYSETYRIPTSIPFILTVGQNTKIYVNITDFVEMNEYGKFTVSVTRNYNGLFSMLLAATLAYKMAHDVNRLPARFLDGYVLMYANMFTRCVASLAGLDEITKEKVKYLATEFALVQMYGTETGLRTFDRFKNTYFPKLTKMIQESIDNSFPEDSFDSLSLFLTQLGTQYPSMRGLTIYKMYEKWIRSYGPATSFSLDYLGYHLYTICMILMESPLINRLMLEPIMEKNKGADLFKAIQQMLA